MKKMRRLIPAIAMLLVSAVMLSTASFAWFSMSTEAKAQNLTVKAVADSSLVIVNAKGKTLAVGDFQDANGIVNLAPTTANPAAQLAPAKIDDKGILTTLDADSVAKVDPSTGAAPSDAKWVEAAPDTNYYDYVVAVGAVGTGVSGTLTANVTATVSKTMHKATSIAFYYTLVTDKTAGQMTYVDTVCFEDMTTAGITQPIVAVSNLLTIDEEDIADYVIVTMRVFFDGEETDAAGDIYAKNTNITADEIKFNVNFTVPDSDSGEEGGEEVTTEEETTENPGE